MRRGWQVVLGLRGPGGVEAFKSFPGFWLLNSLNF